jgi:hypothetical protein
VLRDAVGLAGLAALAYFVFLVDDDSPLTYQGGFLFVSIATAAVIVAIVGDRSRIAGALAFAPLVAIGRRSYSVYLWHWPVFMLTRPGLDVTLDGWLLFVTRIALVFALAEISYRFVETPFRTGAALRAWHRWRLRLAVPQYRPAGFGVAIAAGAVVLAVLAALWQADAPASLSSSSSIAAQLPPALVPVGAAEPPDRPGGSGGAAATPARRTATAPLIAQATVQSTVSLYCTQGTDDHGTVCGTPTPTTVARATLTPTGPPAAPRMVTAIGDSVMLGASPQLSVALGAVDIHAQVGLQASEGAEILRQLRAGGTLGEVVVVHLGNNGEFNAAELAEMMDELKDVALVIFVNLKVPRDWQDNNNRMLADAVDAYSNATLIDWHDQSEDQPQYFWNDGLHLRLEGALVYTARILEEIRADWPLAKSRAVR